MRARETCSRGFPARQHASADRGAPRLFSTTLVRVVVDQPEPLICFCGRLDFPVAFVLIDGIDHDLAIAIAVCSGCAAGSADQIMSAAALAHDPTAVRTHVSGPGRA